jgi:hypothetical protein
MIEQMPITGAIWDILPLMLFIFYWAIVSLSGLAHHRRSAAKQDS